MRWYFEMNNFEGSAIKGLWQDFKMDVKHQNDYEHMANNGWQEMAGMGNPVYEF